MVFTHTKTGITGNTLISIYLYMHIAKNAYGDFVAVLHGCQGIVRRRHLADRRLFHQSVETVVGCRLRLHNLVLDLRNRVLQYSGSCVEASLGVGGTWRINGGKGRMCQMNTRLSMYTARRIGKESRQQVDVARSTYVQRGGPALCQS